MKQIDVPPPSRHSCFRRVPTEVLTQCMFIFYKCMKKIESSPIIMMTHAQKKKKKKSSDTAMQQISYPPTKLIT
jgi:hypothetical protein